MLTSPPEQQTSAPPGALAGDATPPTRAARRLAGFRRAQSRPGSERFLRAQRSRRLRVLRRVAVAALVVGAVVAGIWLVFFSSVLAVHHVEVTGTSLVTPAQARDAARAPLDVPLVEVDLAAIEARVETLQGVRSAEASRAWPDGIAVDVTEREAIAVVDQEGSWRGLDGEGVLFRSYEERPTDLPRVDMRSSTSVDALAEAAAVVAALPDDVLARVGYLDVRTIDAITLHLRSGATVEWGSADQSEDKARVLEQLLQRKASQYDVTAPGRPTLRP